MTLALTLVNAALAVVALAAGRAEPSLQRRMLRILATVGVATGIVTVLARGSFGVWRATTMDPGAAAVAGTAIACGWGLTVALEIERDRWWIAGLNGVGAAALLLFAGAVWIVPALLFWGCLSASLAIAAAREHSRTWVWIALADVATAAVLIAAATGDGSWVFPQGLDAELIAPLALAVALRTGVVPGAGTFDDVGSTSAALIPLTVASGFLLAIRLLDDPLPALGALFLLVAVAGLAPALHRRSFRIRSTASWPPAVGLGLSVALPAASTTAAVAALLGVSVIAAWHEALDRGRLSRAAVVSMIMPNVMFGAVAAVATAAFVEATTTGGWVGRAPWMGVAALLPLVLALGLAFGVAAARTERGGGYHPEAVFMSWMLFAASVGAAFVLGAGGVYAALGGPSAAWLVAVAVTAGGIAAWRGRAGSGAEVEAVASVELGAIVTLPRRVRGAAGVAQGAAVIAVAWLTIAGLKVGFL